MNKCNDPAGVKYETLEIDDLSPLFATGLVENKTHNLETNRHHHPHHQTGKMVKRQFQQQQKATIINMRFAAFLALTLNLLAVDAASLRSATAGQSAQRVLSDRVSQVNTEGVSCMLDDGTRDSPIGNTEIQFYYAIESNVKVERRVLDIFEETLFFTIAGSILWCYGEGGSRSLAAVRQNSRCK
jgi:hypothetical protein